MSQSIKFRPPSFDSIEANNKTHQYLLADEEGFNKLAEIIQYLTGITLPINDKNKTLMAGRIHPLLQKYQFKNYSELAHKLMVGGNKGLENAFISSLTTNTTHFFRESTHYDVLKNYVSERIAKNDFTSNSFRAWCSASSSGQEPYSMLFTLLNAALPVDQISLEFLATDIDLDVLQRASAGNYSLDEVGQLPANIRQVFFQESKNAKDQPSFRVASKFRKMINFAKFNLIQDKPNFKDKFDIIFCRNVLIYFEKDTATAVVDMLISQLKPDGLLFLGHVETGLLKNKNVKAISHAVYKKL